MRTDIQIRNYLDGRMESGLLLIGSQYQRMYDDAIKVASSVLSVQATDILSHPDFLMITPEKKSLGVDDVIPVIQKAQLRPAISNRQVAVVDGFDTMTVSAQNKLLKLIEESELLVIGIAKEDKMLKTIKSRMRVVKYSPLPLSEYISVSDDNSVSSYFASCQGADGESDENLIRLFNDVSLAVKEKREKDLFVILSLVKEKDADNFFSIHRDKVSSLISLLGTLYSKMSDAGRVKLCMEHKERCTLPSYTGNDFFLFVAGIYGGN